MWMKSFWRGFGAWLSRQGPRSRNKVPLWLAETVKNFHGPRETGYNPSTDDESSNRGRLKVQVRNCEKELATPCSPTSEVQGATREWSVLDSFLEP
jgi:hypothetical protein